MGRRRSRPGSSVTGHLARKGQHFKDNDDRRVDQRSTLPKHDPGDQHAEKPYWQLSERGQPRMREAPSEISGRVSVDGAQKSPPPFPVNAAFPTVLNFRIRPPRRYRCAKITLDSVPRSCASTNTASERSPSTVR